jgi:hypothetical protein
MSEKSALLPLGSIVLLKNGSKRIMIYGRKQMELKTKEIYDYIACLYPEGNINEEYTFLFNHDDIKDIVYRGFSDIDEEVFLEYLSGLEV